MESKIEKHKSRFTITQLILMAMAKAPGSCCSLEYLHEKTGVDKKEADSISNKVSQKRNNRKEMA